MSGKSNPQVLFVRRIRKMSIIVDFVCIELFSGMCYSFLTAELTMRAAHLCTKTLGDMSPLPALHLGSFPVWLCRSDGAALSESHCKGVTNLDALTLIIADGSSEFRQALDDALSDTYRIVQCSNGKQALAAALEFKPELIVLDLMLTELDGLSLLYSIREAGLRPIALAVTCFFNSYIQDNAQSAGIYYIIRKPCDPIAVASRVRDLATRMDPRMTRPIDPRTYIAELTKDLMFSPRHQGSKFLQEAVLIALNEPDISLTKDLYPRLGRRFGGTALQVEHCLRTAITAACKKSNGQLWDRFFPVDPSTGVRQTTNGTVIYKLADELRAKLEADRRLNSSDEG